MRSPIGTGTTPGERRSWSGWLRISERRRWVTKWVISLAIPSAAGEPTTMIAALDESQQAADRVIDDPTGIISAKDDLHRRLNRALGQSQRPLDHRSPQPTPDDRRPRACAPRAGRPHSIA